MASYYNTERQGMWALCIIHSQVNHADTYVTGACGQVSDLEIWDLDILLILWLPNTFTHTREFTQGTRYNTTLSSYQERLPSHWNGTRRRHQNQMFSPFNEWQKGDKVAGLVSPRTLETVSWTTPNNDNDDNTVQRNDSPRCTIIPNRLSNISSSIIIS